MADLYGMDRVLDIAKKYALPDWWVLSVIIEYFDCRRYAENGRMWTFDFNKPSEQEIKTIPEKKVVIPGYVLTQNIHPDDLPTRASFHETVSPSGALGDPNFVPIGLVNSTASPGVRISIKKLDPKMLFDNPLAIVLDDGFFYQWYLKESDDGSVSKNIFDEPEFSDVEEKTQMYNNSPNDKQLHQQLKTAIEYAYKKLEKRREKLRQKILDYHNEMKKIYGTAWTNTLEPPAGFHFDAIMLTEEGYQTQTQMAPVFRRSAVRNLHRAERVKMRPGSNMENYYVFEKLEYSTMCIISAASCLEEYISYVIKKYLPAESDIFERANHKQKWLWVPAALNLPFRFKPDEEPYRSFSSIIALRNNAVHYKAKYDKVKDGISHASNQLNVENARIAVRVIKDMITKLSEGGRVPLPEWIKNHDASVAFWDED